VWVATGNSISIGQRDSHSIVAIIVGCRECAHKHRRLRKQVLGKLAEFVRAGDELDRDLELTLIEHAHDGIAMSINQGQNPGNCRVIVWEKRYAVIEVEADRAARGELFANEFKISGGCHAEPARSASTTCKALQNYRRAL
jgi:hypothetical protein